MTHEYYIKQTIEAALENVKAGRGGPFAALIVKHNRIVAAATNEVTSRNDPTAHAEVQVIRKACSLLETYQLADCVLYTSCEPCPMCLGAIYWARCKKIYYAFTRHEAATAGFDDAFIYNELSMNPALRSIPAYSVSVPIADDSNPFLLWKTKADRRLY